jgi:uroporphyrinogen decarboxylase
MDGTKMGENNTSDLPDTAEAPRFLRACAKLPVDRTPIWLMRQAGRYMREYQEVRRRYSLLDIIHSPELSCQVTLQPVDAFAVDAAIIFADILPPLESIGLRVAFQAGEGPVIENPVRTEEDVRALGGADPGGAADSYASTLEAIKLAKREIGSLPLIGFGGAPFTLACYSVQGSGSKDFALAKRLMMGRPELWHELMGKLTSLVIRYLRAQAEAGADALQLFDTWAGLLSPSDYRTFAFPYARRVVEALADAGKPLIYFSVGTGCVLEEVVTCGANVIGVDWRVDLAEACRRLGDVAVQGNLDPVALLGDWPATRKRAAEVLEAAGGRPGHIFNLGHGVLQDTPPDNVRRLVEFVHEWVPEQP